MKFHNCRVPDAPTIATWGALGCVSIPTTADSRPCASSVPLLFSAENSLKTAASTPTIKAFVVPTTKSGEVNPSDYTADANVNQLSRNGDILRRYNFVGLFPTNISEIPLSMDTTDTIEEFTVEMQVLYWTISAIQESSTEVAPAVN